MPPEPVAPRARAVPRLLVALAFVVAAVAVPVGTWWPLAALGAILLVAMAAARVGPWRLARRGWGAAILAGLLALMIAPGHPARPALGTATVAAAIAAKSTLALAGVLLLAEVTPAAALLGAMARLGAPELVVASLMVMERYRFVLGDELRRMERARRARSFRRGGVLGWSARAGLIGALFVRAFERGERVHSAMLARGWDGTARGLDEAGTP